MGIDRPRFRVPVPGDIELSILRREPDEPRARQAPPGPQARQAPDEPRRVSFVLIHGLASNARTWDGVADELARHGYESVAVDLRGHGHSDKPDAGYDVGTVAEDVCALLDHLHLDRPVLAGQSWGGNVVLEAAARRPDALRGVVAVDGGTIELAEEFPDWEACWTRLAPPHLVGTSLADLEGWLREAHPDWPESGILGTMANFEIRPDGTVAPWLTREHHRAVLRGLWEHSPRRLYERIEVPVLLAPARSEREDHARSVSQRRHVREASRSLPRARVRWFEGADHDIQAHRPVELADVMIRCLSDGFFAP